MLDLHLPDSLGSEVLEQLADDSRTRAIPVVMLTADAAPGKRDQLLAAGARALLTKPLDARSFLGVVDRFLVRQLGEKSAVDRATVSSGRIFP